MHGFATPLHVWPAKQSPLTAQGSAGPGPQTPVAQSAMLLWHWFNVT